MVGRRGRADPVRAGRDRRRRRGRRRGRADRARCTGSSCSTRPTRVLRPAILWNDQRTAAECDVIRAAVGPERLIAITGNDALTGFTAPKLVWVRDHEPDVWRADRPRPAAQGLRPLRLTGEHAIDKADGAGTLLFDLAARDWSAEVARRAADRSGVAAADVRGTRGDRHRHAPRPPPRPACGRARRSSRAAATRRPTRSGSAPSTPGPSRSRSARRASCSPRPTGRFTSRAGRVHAFCHAVPGSLAPDVGDALGRRQPALVPRRRSRRAWTSGTCRPRPPTSRPAATACCSCPTSPASAARTRTRWPAARSSG